MAIAASSILPENSLEDFRIEFNNLVSDVTGITATNKFDENIIFEGATADAFETTLTVTDPTADRTVTIPNVTGTVLLGTQANPDSADGAALGSASAEWSDLYLADSGNIYFGNDQEIVLGHNPDVGLLLKNANAADDKPIVLNLQTGEQDIQADDVLGSIRFNAPDEGTGTDALLVGAAIDAISEGDFSSSSNATKLAFRTGASETATEKMALTSGGNLQLPTDGAVLSFGADSEITLTHVHNQGLRMEDSDKLSFGAGDDLQIYHDGTNSYVSDQGTGNLTLQSNQVNIINTSSETLAQFNENGAVELYYDNAKKLETASGGVNITGALDVTTTIQGTTITAETAVVPDASDGAALGTNALEWSDLFLADGATIQFGDDQDVSITHVADSGLTFKHTDTADDSFFTLTLQTGDTDIAVDDIISKIAFQAPDEGTGTDAILVAAAIQAVSEGDFSSSSNATRLEFHTGASETATNKMAVTSNGALSLPTDGAQLRFGADSDVTLEHQHDTGLLLNGSRQFQFGDSGTYIHQSADGVLDLVSDTEIEINATTIDINGAVEISGTTTQTGVSTSTAKDVFNAGMSVKNGSTSAGFIEFFEDSDNGTNKVTLIGPSSTSDVTITLPASTDTVALQGDVTALAIALG